MLKQIFIVKFLGILILLMVHQITFGQRGSTNDPSTAVPKSNISPSPESASLGKYGDLPIGMFKGSSQVDIPIYTVKKGNITIPITINYSSNGIKVNDISTTVGLGWTLLAGGAITFSQNDKNDHYSTRPVNLDPKTFNPNSGSKDADYNFAKNYISSAVSNDLQPDMYYYNFCGFSGKFFFDADETIGHSVPKNDFQIRRNSNGWAFTDAQGTVFTFNNGEVSEVIDSVVTGNPRSGAGVVQNLAMYLTRIQDAKGNIVNFEYTQTAYTYLSGVEETVYQLMPNGACSLLSPITSYKIQNIRGPKLKRISSPDNSMEVIFQYNQTDREDLMHITNSADSVTSLKAIVVKAFGNKIKKYTLDQGYFRTSTFDPNSTADVRALNSRLKLISLTEEGAKPYIFNYDESINLPKRMSFATDYWGYYNRVHTNNTGIPTMSTFNFVGANREADPVSTSANILKKIYYPTGGSTEIKYEQNEESSYKNVVTTTPVNNRFVAGAGAIVTKELVVTTIQPQAVITYNLVNGGHDPGFATITGPNGFNYELGQSGTIPNVFLAVGTYTINIDNFGGNQSINVSINWTTSSSSNQLVKTNQGGVRVRETVDQPLIGPVVKKYYRYNIDGSETSLESSWVGKEINPLMYHKVYTTTIFPNELPRDCSYHVLYSNPIPLLGKDSPDDYGYRTVTVLTDSLGYQGKIVNTFSVGPNDFINPYSTSNTGLRDIGWLKGQLLKQEFFRYDLASVQYKRAKSINNEYVLNYDPAYLGNNTDTARPPNQYSIYGMQILQTRAETQQGLLSTMAAFEVQVYPIVSAWFNLSKTEEKQYDFTDDTKFTLNTISNYYDNPNHLQLTRSVAVRSNGRTLTNVSLYPDDYATGTPFLDDLKSKHIIGAPVEQVTFQNDGVNTSILNGRITQYKPMGKGLVDKTYRLESPTPVDLSLFKFSNNAVGNLPGTNNIGVFGRDSRYTEEMIFNRFDDIGNPLMLTYAGKVPTVYIWGYNRQYPLAEITNADYSAVVAALGGEMVVDAFSASNPADDNVVSSFISPLRAALPNAFITSYTHKPLVGLTSQTDAKGMTTSYSYDTFNRLENIRDQNGDIVKNYRYNYADGSTPPAGTLHKNREVTIYKTRNNCGAGQQSVPIAHIVPANTYSSTESIDAADQVARTAEDAIAQAKANNLGVCTTPTPGTVSLSFSVPSQFRLKITNTATNIATDYIITGSNTITNIPSGTVNVTLTDDVPGGAIYNFNLNGEVKSGNSVTFSGVSFAVNAALTVTRTSSGSHYNTAFDIAKTKTNCPSGTGTSVNYPVAANLYPSTISVTDANDKARIGEDARAQANANKLGGCTINGTTTYYSQLTLVTKTRNNCPNGVSGVPSEMSYPAGAYTSTISVADADQQLHAAAQQHANSTGGCAITSGTFSLNFVAPLSSHFSVHFKDAAGNTLRNLTIHGNHVINDLPGGTGSITIAPWPSPPDGLTFSYSVNGGTAQPTAPAQFTGVALSGTINVNVVQTRFANQVLTVAKTRNNCTNGEVGSTVNYIVPAATYWAASQTGADQLAQADANANAQNYANSNGTCSIATSPFGILYTYGAKLLIEVTHLTNNTTVSYTSNGTNSGTTLYVPNGLSKVKVTSLQVGKIYSVALPGQVQTGAVVEYASFNFLGYTINMNIREIFSNATLNVSKTKENCYGGQVGSTVTYTVPAGKYTSMLSQAQVDQWAQNEADANAQDYANTNGTCLTVYYSSVLPISKTKNDCPSGQVGSAVNYYVYGGKYTSTISQADADQKAVIGEDANAQAYANAHGTCTAPPTYYNAYLSVTKTRNNCATNYVGTSVTYTVPGAKYSSLISQADANQKAQADADANAQNYANTNGTCTPPVTYYSQSLSVYKTKNNCTIDEVGSSVNYAVPYGKYTSLISQADANQKAQADVDANAQNNANTIGTCSPKPVSINYSVPTGIRFELYATMNGVSTLHYITGNGTVSVPRGTFILKMYNVTANDSNIYKFKLNNVLHPSVSSSAEFGPLDYTTGGTITLEITPYP